MTSIKYYQTLSWLTSNRVAIRCHGDEKETVSAAWRTQYWLLLCLFILIFCCLYMGSNFPCPTHISTMSYYVSVIPESMSQVQKEIKHRVPPHLVSCGMKAAWLSILPSLPRWPGLSCHISSDSSALDFQMPKPPPRSSIIHRVAWEICRWWCCHKVKFWNEKRVFFCEKRIQWKHQKNTNHTLTKSFFFAYHLVALECAGIKRWFFINLLPAYLWAGCIIYFKWYMFLVKIPLIYAVDTTRHLHIYIYTYIHKHT